MTILTNAQAAFSIEEAASYTGLSRSSLYRLIDDNTLPSIKLRGRRLIRRIDLDALLEAFCEGGNDAAA